VGSGLGVATETRNEGEIEVEDVLQPLDGSSGLVCEDFDEIGTSLVSGRFQGVIVELLDAVLDAEIDLCAGESTVDTGGGLCGVATKEGLLVKDKNVSTVKVDGVGGTETGQSTTDDNYSWGHDVEYVKKRRDKMGE
jgi:hypothetical protein